MGHRTHESITRRRRRTPSRLIASLTCGEPENNGERPLGAVPQLADEILTAGPDEAAQDERDDQHVVELTGDGNEIRYQVEWEREVPDERQQGELAATRDSRVACKAADEAYAVGDESRKGARVVPPAEDDKRDHKGGIDNSCHGQPHEQPRPPRHLKPVDRDPGPCAAVARVDVVDELRPRAEGVVEGGLPRIA